MILTIPIPPSANNMFVNGKRGRYRSPKYTAWIKKCADQARRQWLGQGKPAFSGKLSVTMHLNLNYTGDIDNRIKPILDLLVKAVPGMPDDRYVDRLLVIRDREVNGAVVFVEAVA